MWWLDRVSQSLLSFLLSIERRQSGNTHTPSPPHIYIRYADFLDNASDFDLYDATDSHTEGITEGCTATEIINSCSPPPLPTPRHGLFEKVSAPGDLRSAIFVPPRDWAIGSFRVFVLFLSFTRPFCCCPSVDRSNDGFSQNACNGPP